MTIPGRKARGLMTGVVLVTALMACVAQAASVHVSGVLHADRPGARVNPDVFGQFSEFIGSGIYGGIWVGPHSDIPNIKGFRSDVVHALRELKVPVVRWPGGCFADRYHWRDGVGPRNQRPVTENTSWGGGDDSNAFGTREFLSFAHLIGAKPFIATNVGSAPPSEMVHWLDYMTSTSHSKWAQMRRRDGRDQPWKLGYIGVGNELWGCGGNMTAEYAADVYRRYQTFVHVDGQPHIEKIAPGANGADYHWIKVMMRDAGKYMDGIGLHYYTQPGPWAHKLSATRFDEQGWIRTLSAALHMDTLISKDSAIMDHFDPEKRVALDVDEWGTWFRATPGSNPAYLRQQNTLRDAMVAALTLNIFVDHADRVRMANIAQMVNVLQSMILTRGRTMVLTPTYYVFKMFKPYQGATVLPLQISTPEYHHDTYTVPAIQATAVRGKGGHVYVAIVSLDPQHGANISIRLDGGAFSHVSGRVLSATRMTAKNTFATPTRVQPEAFKDAQLRAGTLHVRMPAKSLVMLQLD